MIDKLYVLRTVASDGGSRNGFRWPLVVGAKVEAPDWDANPQRDCGGGLHGLPWGVGESALLDWSLDAKWLVVEVNLRRGCTGSVGKCRFRVGVVRAVGDRKTTTDYLLSLGANPAYVPGVFLTGGDYATLTGGYMATLTGGYMATLTGGYMATLTGGDYATLTGGYMATLTGGDYATLTGGDYATLTGGNRATLTGGYRATLTGGYRATLTGGYMATLCWRFWYCGYRRVVVAYVGEGDIKPNVKYELCDGKVVKC